MLPFFIFFPIKTFLQRPKFFSWWNDNFKDSNLQHHIVCWTFRSQYISSFKLISPLHVTLWVSLSGTLRIVFQSHLVLCASIRLIVRNNFTFCFLHYFPNFFSKFWYFIIVINPIFLANSKNSLMPRMKSKLIYLWQFWSNFKR